MLVAHLSDPHFGTEDPAIAAALLDELRGTTAPRADLVAISGDLTQRAKPEQFEAACAYLRALRAPYLVVPGNHDIPLFHLYERFVDPLRRYRRYVTDELAPRFANGCLLAAGLATAHGRTTKHGRITDEQVRGLCRQLAGAAEWKLLVAHHPFVVGPGQEADRVRGAEDALPRLEDCGLDVILTGHLHVPLTDETAHRSPDHRIISVHAGTCLSRRLRGEPNGYNRLRFHDERVDITHRVWDGRRFVDGATKRYLRTKTRPQAGHEFARV